MRCCCGARPARTAFPIKPGCIESGASAARGRSMRSCSPSTTPACRPTRRMAGARRAFISRRSSTRCAGPRRSTFSISPARTRFIGPTPLLPVANAPRRPMRPPSKPRCSNCATASPTSASNNSRAIATMATRRSYRRASTHGARRWRAGWRACPTGSAVRCRWPVCFLHRGLLPEPPHRARTALGRRRCGAIWPMPRGARQGVARRRIRSRCCWRFCWEPSAYGAPAC
ncbi:hypothetical protein BamMEX5DRAFT_3307 [Burkholderia ambifaria MEX-5]|uniref:Uncharacterized protein n=1 Tax=Burkholderia ambifaria MEX-5 TaxID=396597 RepID=B1T691_9BURK|nr:hypothetical protein BamMEX5DRAFT_3307 [Burkholderia ambifaria MEX-5]